MERCRDVEVWNCEDCQKRVMCKKDGMHGKKKA